MGISGPQQRGGAVREAERVGMMRRLQCQFADMSVATDQRRRVHHVTIPLQHGHPLHCQFFFLRPGFQMKLVLRPRRREMRICGYYSKISQVMNLSSADSFQHHGRRDTFSPHYVSYHGVLVAQNHVFETNECPITRQATKPEVQERDRGERTSQDWMVFKNTDVFSLRIKEWNMLTSNGLCPPTESQRQIGTIK
jgi:hypothetical protein